MSTLNRRKFLQTTSAVTSGVAVAASARPGQSAASADGRLVLGIIGCGGRGSGLAKSFASMSDIAYVCDPDRSRCESLREAVQAKAAVTDLRRVLDDKSVDAVVIATPDHWHAPAAILACQAGKHVYVEKPCSHNLREGRLLVDAARHNNVTVQHGTQSRSRPLIANAVQLIREGVIGEVLIAKAWNIQRRRNIGHAQPSDPPPGVDYDSWVGPAEYLPHQANRFHYDWHWWYNFGTGDIGNDGTHEIDYARWGLGVDGLPATATATGGKYYFDDDQEFPDTATCAFEWPGDDSVGRRRQLIFEMRIWSTNFPYNCDSGAEFYGTAGRLFVSKRGKLEVYGERNARIEGAEPKSPVQFVGNHQFDFVDAIRTGRKPTADIAIAHDFVALVHLANAAIRLGRSLQIDAEGESVIGDDEANQLLTRPYREGGHWAIPQGA